MNTRTRTRILFAVFVIIALVFGTNAKTFAAETERMEKPNYNCVIKNDKIQDTEILLNRAYTDINDAPKKVVEKIKEKSALLIDGVKQEVKPLVTTELLSRHCDGNDTIDTYAATIISEMSPKEDQLIVNRASSDYSKREKKNSSGGEITLTTTIYFTVKILIIPKNP